METKPIINAPSLLQKADSHYQDAFNTMVMNQSNKVQLIAIAKQILAFRTSYEAITGQVNRKMPWYFMGILHYRESNCSFKRHLHNGDPLTARTVRVPAGRPLKGSAPFTFLQSAVDALTMPGQNFQLETDWSLNRMLYRFEKWNGFGYVKLAKKHADSGITNPYLWSGTNHYKGGKYASDGHYNARLYDFQMGAAPLLRLLTDKTLGIV